MKNSSELVVKICSDRGELKRKDPHSAASSSQLNSECGAAALGPTKSPRLRAFVEPGNELVPRMV